MKKNAIIVLSLVLAAAIISGLVLYGQYVDKKDALLDSEKEISGLNEKIDQLNTDISARNDQIRKKANLEKKLYGVQFHPEVVHTLMGREILANFLFRICGEQPEWQMSSFIENEVRAIRSQVGTAQTVCALSGGVDSAVAATLTFEAIGKQLHCIFVNNGLLRHGEEERVKKIFGKRFGKMLHFSL